MAEVYNTESVANILAEAFCDTCACNFNGYDEWLPYFCDYAETSCPNPPQNGCWEQWLKWRHKVEVVRCKDCKWCDTRTNDCHNPRFGDGWANYPPPSVREDFFCGDGERKTDG